MGNTTAESKGNGKGCRRYNIKRKKEGRRKRSRRMKRARVNTYEAMRRKEKRLKE